MAFQGNMSSADRVAVVYLARQAEGLHAFRRFVETYRAHPAGLAHQLIVAYKGFRNGEGLEQARATFSDLHHLAIEVDDRGFDIGAYGKVAQRIDHEYICFLNTFTEIAADGWLDVLYRHASMPSVGVAGATGSYESSHDSIAIARKVLWLWLWGQIEPNDSIAHYFDFVINGSRRRWKQQGCKSWDIALRTV